MYFLSESIFYNRTGVANDVINNAPRDVAYVSVKIWCSKGRYASNINQGTEYLLQNTLPRDVLTR